MQHPCFMSSGRPEEDSQLGMVVARFLQHHQKYVSVVKGGFAGKTWSVSLTHSLEHVSATSFTQTLFPFLSVSLLCLHYYILFFLYMTTIAQILYWHNSTSFDWFINIALHSLLDKQSRVTTVLDGHAENRWVEPLDPEAQVGWVFMCWWLQCFRLVFPVSLSLSFGAWKVIKKLYLLYIY